MNQKKIIVSFLMVMLLLFFIRLKKQNNREENDLALLNIEALAQNENEEGFICIGIGSLDCPNGYKVAYIGPPYNGVLQIK